MFIIIIITTLAAIFFVCACNRNKIYDKTNKNNNNSNKKKTFSTHTHTHMTTFFHWFIRNKKIKHQQQHCCVCALQSYLLNLILMDIHSIFWKQNFLYPTLFIHSFIFFYSLVSIWFFFIVMVVCLFFSKSAPVFVHRTQ